MNRIKVINEPSELVPMLRSVDTPVKRDVLKEVTLEWRTADEIEEKFGPEGRDAIVFFEKMKLVETRWLSKDGGYPEKSYHTYYTSFSMNAQWPVYEISDVLTAAMMSDEEYLTWEEKILAEVGKNGRFSGDVAEALGLTSTMLKSLVRRSVKMDYRGHRIELLKDERGHPDAPHLYNEDRAQAGKGQARDHACGTVLQSPGGQRDLCGYQGPSAGGERPQRGRKVRR